MRGSCHHLLCPGPHSVALVLSFLSLDWAFADPWPQWRGPGASAVSAESGLPLNWNNAEGIRWKCSLPGAGNSSPIVWENRVFLTCETPQELLVVCIDRTQGRIIWQKASPGGERGSTHDWNGYASSTPATDGKRVYAFFQPTGLVALDFDGKQVWRQPLSTIDSIRSEWGSASSPFLDGSRLLVSIDHDGQSFIAAVDADSGNILWSTHRKTGRGYASPVLIKTENRKEVVISGQNRVFAYDLEQGQELWYCWGMTQWVTPTVVFAHGLVYAVSGRDGPTLAIRPGGKGDVTRDHVAWRASRGAPYLPSPIVYGDYFYMTNDNGVVTCFDAKTGAQQYQDRLGSRGQHSASPVAGDGKIYFLAEDGTCTVLKAGPKFEVLAQNRLEGEYFRASPAISNGQIFIRAQKSLYCIGKP